MFVIRAENDVYPDQLASKTPLVIVSHIDQRPQRPKAVVPLLLIHCFMYLPLFVAVLR